VNDVVGALEASKRGVATEVEVVPRKPFRLFVDCAFSPNPKQLVFVGCGKTRKDLVQVVAPFEVYELCPCTLRTQSREERSEASIYQVT
jgi:hypothetical protein